MRFLSLIRINESAGQRPGEKLMADMSRLIDEMSRAGVLLDTGGLRPTSEGKRVRLSRGRQRVMTGHSPRPRKWSAATSCSRPTR